MKRNRHSISISFNTFNVAMLWSAIEMKLFNDRYLNCTELSDAMLFCHAIFCQIGYKQHCDLTQTILLFKAKQWYYISWLLLVCIAKMKPKWYSLRIQFQYMLPIAAKLFGYSYRYYTILLLSNLVKIRFDPMSCLRYSICIDFLCCQSLSWKIPGVMWYIYKTFIMDSCYFE